MFYRLSISLLTIAAGLCAGAATLEEAKQMYLQEDYAGALPVFQEYLASAAKDASLNHWTGVCLMKTGNLEEAIPLLEYAETKGIVESPRYLAEIALDEYRVEDAQAWMDAYRKALKKNKKSMPEDAEQIDGMISRISSMLESVEKITVIDSIAVDKEDFFKFYRLSQESGRLEGIDVLPQGMEAKSPTAVYLPQIGQEMFWAAPGEDGYSQLVSVCQLADGSWDGPQELGETLGEGGNANYPFLMADGVTLYFANDGDHSIGGYDIFISRRNDDGEFLQPQNIGMPYNSPFDDYMLAIDEVTGVGWWATDRNHIEGKVTIYKFIPNEMRVNYDEQDPWLADYARVTSIKDTWEKGADYSGLLQKIEALSRQAPDETPLFRISMPDGRIYTGYGDFRNDRARTAMEKYMDQLQQYESDQLCLEDLRSRYARGDRSVSEEISVGESSQLSLEEKLRQMLDTVVRLEMNIK